MPPTPGKSPPIVTLYLLFTLFILLYLFYLLLLLLFYYLREKRKGNNKGEIKVNFSIKKRKRAIRRLGPMGGGHFFGVPTVPTVPNLNNAVELSMQEEIYFVELSMQEEIYSTKFPMGAFFRCPKSSRGVPTS